MVTEGEQRRQPPASNELGEAADDVLVEAELFLSGFERKLAVQRRAHAKIEFAGVGTLRNWDGDLFSRLGHVAYDLNDEGFKALNGRPLFLR
jgi:hypothetical protein